MGHPDVPSNKLLLLPTRLKVLLKLLLVLVVLLLLLEVAVLLHVLTELLQLTESFEVDFRREYVLCVFCASSSSTMGLKSTTPTP
jgi:hypothetical protein